VDGTLWVGFAAGFLTTASFVPQLIKIWKTKSAEDVSRRMFIAVSVGMFLWLIYGIALGQIPMIVWNSVSLVLALAILVLKHRFG
jgi:MtN3 and saliva related transmembrane protein